MSTQDILRAVARAYRAFRDGFVPGRSAGELFCAFTDSLREDLGEYELVYDYLCGKDSVNIDGVSAGEYVPKLGDTVLMDISVGVGGAWCDVCRTFFVGEPTEAQGAAFSLIRDSLRAGAAALRAGAPAKEIYAAANSVYLPRGKTLVHHAGHRIAGAPLAQPQFLPEDPTALVAGEIYTVETGLYEGFGLRLENDYLVNEQGATDLFEPLLPLQIEEYVLKWKN